MNSKLEHFLPSSRFVSTISAIGAAAGLVIAAQYFTAPHPTNDTASPATEQVSENWRDTLYAIEGNNASTSLPTGPSDEEIAQVLKKAQTDNVTESVSRTLATKLIAAEQQGLGNDAVSQDRIIAEGLAQTKIQKDKYTLSDLNIVDDGTSTLHDYGNAVILAAQKHSQANMNDALFIIGTANDNNDPKELAKLTPIAQAYSDTAADLLSVPTPRNMASLHLLAVNNMIAIGESLTAAQTLFSDPLKGLIGVQQFNALLSDESRVFATIAEQFQKRSILFYKGEPGAAWSVFRNQ